MQPLSEGHSSLPRASKSFRDGAVTCFSFKERISFFLHCKEKINIHSKQESSPKARVPEKFIIGMSIYL